MLEFTYVMIKPDIMVREKKEREIILSDIFNIINSNSLDIISVQKEKLSKEKVKEHYAHLKGKFFYNDLVNFMVSGDVLEMIVFGENAVEKIRSIIGPTNVKKARESAPYSIRAKYGDENFGPANSIHASDSKENASIEIKRFFNIDICQPIYTNNVKNKKLLEKHIF